jgi:hypothetical protein
MFGINRGEKTAVGTALIVNSKIARIVMIARSVAIAKSDAFRMSRIVSGTTAIAVRAKGTALVAGIGLINRTPTPKE